MIIKILLMGQLLVLHLFSIAQNNSISMGESGEISGNKSLDLVIYSEVGAPNSLSLINDWGEVLKIPFFYANDEIFLINQPLNLQSDFTMGPLNSFNSTGGFTFKMDVKELHEPGESDVNFIVKNSNGQNIFNLFESGFLATKDLQVQGDLEVLGTISKSGGTFKIDQPVFPEKKWLYHSFIESPDMMNVYNGNTITDDKGMAIVKLPGYFEALNKDFKYQLTTIGSFSKATIHKEITNNQFTIKSQEPHVKVSWQITGVRKDKWAEENRVKVEVDKNSNETDIP